MTCEHTFGHIDNQDAGRHIVEGKKNLKLYYDNRMKDFEPFTYCPDCGALLAPIIAEITGRETLNLRSHCNETI